MLGASGSGKSSVVLAGLVPKLENEGHWKFTHFRPGEGDDPFHALALALVPLLKTKLFGDDKLKETRKIAESLRNRDYPLSDVLTEIQHNHPNERVLLIADQFEELYTPCGKQKIHRSFLDTLLACFQSSPSQSQYNHVLIATMRADFLGNVLSYRPFADLLQNADIKLGPMNRDELSQVIVKPADKLGVSFETGLVERILDDVDSEPGNLPLLEFALTQLWKQQKSKQLTHGAYEEIGKVQGALASYADKKYREITSKIDPEEVRRIFIQLVRPGEGTEDTRRLATKAELGKQRWELVKQLADERLVVTSRNAAEQETVEVVHDALIGNWDELQQWMDTNREFRTWQERLKTRIQEWKDGKGELLSKTRLKIAEEWLHQRGKELSLEQKKFIQKSRQTQNINRWLVIGITSFMGIFVVGTGAEIYKNSCDVRLGQDCFRFIITSGDSKLFVGTTNIYLEEGIKEFSSAFSFSLKLFGIDIQVPKWKLDQEKQEKLKSAQKYFEQAKNAAPHDPIPLIYYNNTKALFRGTPYKLAVVVPVDTHEETARNLLRGVASAQDEFNKGRRNLDLPLLEIIIANDKNNPEISRQVARKLLKEEVLAIIGHRSSSSSMAAADVYENKGIAMISPTSSSTELDKKTFFFRTVASNKEYAKDLYEYTIKECNPKNNNHIWVLYEDKSEYSRNLKENFEKKAKNKIEIVPNDLNAFLKKDVKKEIKNKIEKNRIKCAILIPSTNTLSIALSVIHAHEELYQKTNLDKYNIKFLTNWTLHNTQSLKKNGFLISEELRIVVPTSPFNRSYKKTFDQKWGENVSWRIDTSYEATKLLIDEIKKLDNNPKVNSNSLKEKRKFVLNSLKDNRNPSSSQKNQKSCLIKLQDTLKNKYNKENCYPNN
ncbi:MAG: ABC transporter substrate-binding protein [Calothrix sp. MO_167.B42]|nr:ABC transporter substrate-binding protein [Calothrix sp. MO_167.B42]